VQVLSVAIVQVTSCGVAPAFVTNAFTDAAL